MQLDDLLKKNPKDTAARFLKAEACLANGNAQTALDQVNIVATASPENLRAISMRARIHMALGNEAEAIADYERILVIEPNRIEALVDISQLLARSGRHDEADTAIRAAIKIDPKNVSALLRFAAHQEETGQTEEAVDTCLTILELKPGQPSALEKLARLSADKFGERISAEAKKALKVAENPSIDRASLNFALATIAKSSSNSGDFAAYIRQANENLAAFHPYNQEYEDNLTSSLIERFQSHPAASEPHGSGSPRPVFIVGLPRSGTTLVEAILACHPNVFSLGERNSAGRLLASVINSGQPFGPDEQSEFRISYDADQPAQSQNAIVRVDKMPENYRLVGFLINSLPGCRIINMRRDPRDLALSLWQAHFSGSALSYAYDLKAMAHKFNQYAALANHWQNVFPDQILDVSYEDLVADIDTSSRRIAEFCELEWLESMTRPHETTGAVLTLSATQVRQPVHTRSVGAWREHEKMLAPFIEGLDKSLWPNLG